MFICTILISGPESDFASLCTKKIKLVSFTPVHATLLQYQWDSLTRRISPAERASFFSKLTLLQNTKLLQGKSLKTLHENEVQTFSRHKQIGCFDNFSEDEIAFM